MRIQTWIILVLFIIKFCCNISISPSTSTSQGSKIVRAETTLTISVTFISMLTTERLRLDFPGTRTYFNIGGSTVTCSVGTCANTGSAPAGTFTCTWDSANRQLSITSSSDLSLCTTLPITFQNYLNNEYTATETVTARGIDSSSNLASSTSMTVSYSVATAASVTFTPQSTEVAATGELLVSFNVGVFALSSSFNIQLTFPDRFNDEDAYFPTASYTCRNGTGNIASAPTCTATASDATGISVVTVSGLYSSTIAASDTASFYIANIKNPISAAVVSGISMTIYNPTSTNHLIASRSSLTMQVSDARPVSSFSISFVSPTTVGVYSTANQYMSIVITPGVLIEGGCRASVTFPSDIVYQSTVIAFGVVTSVSYSSGNLTIGNIDDSSCQLSSSVSSTITIYVTVRGPPQKKDTGNFLFSLTTSAGSAIATGTAFVPESSITTGDITNFVFEHTTGASTTVQEATEWKIGFTLGNPLTNPWVIVVTYPNGEFSITGCTPSNGVGLTIASTTCSVSGNTLTIEGTYALAAGAVSMEGVTGTNPTAVFDTGTFTVNSFNNISGTNYAVDEYDTTDTSFTNPFQATAQSLNSVSVALNSASDNVTGATSVQYDFTVSHKSTIPANAIIKLTIPVSNCLTMYDSGGSSVSTIEFTNLISTSKSNATPLTFSWTNFTNPRATNVA